MKYLRILNWALFAGGALMAVLFAVVSLMLVIYRQQAAEIGSDVSTVIFVWTAFCVFTVVSGLAAWALQRRHPWMWAGQAALLLAVGGMAILSYSLNQL